LRVFYGHIKADLEVEMAITRQNDQRKGIRRESRRRKTDIKTTTIEGKEDKEQEVTVPSKEIRPSIQIQPIENGKRL